LAAFLFNPWWLLSLAAIGNGVYVFRSLRDGGTAVRSRLAAQKMKVAAIAGMVLGGIAAGLKVLGTLGELAR
jgi:branched-subunit amino acid permease